MKPGVCTRTVEFERFRLQGDKQDPVDTLRGVSDVAQLQAQQLKNA